MPGNGHGEVSRGEEAAVENPHLLPGGPAPAAIDSPARLTTAPASSSAAVHSPDRRRRPLHHRHCAAGGARPPSAQDHDVVVGREPAHERGAQKTRPTGDDNFHQNVRRGDPLAKQRIDHDVSSVLAARRHRPAPGRRARPERSKARRVDAACGRRPTAARGLPRARRRAARARCASVSRCHSASNIISLLGEQPRQRLVQIVERRAPAVPQPRISSHVSCARRCTS